MEPTSPRPPRSRKRWEARPSISVPGNAAISTLLRWLASSVALAGRRDREQRAAGLLQGRSAHPPEPLPGVPPARRNRAHAVPHLRRKRVRGPRRSAHRSSRCARCRRGSPIRAMGTSPTTVRCRRREIETLANGRTPARPRRRSEGRAAAAPVAAGLEHRNARPGVRNARAVSDSRAKAPSSINT